MTDLIYTLLYVTSDFLCTLLAYTIIFEAKLHEDKKRFLLCGVFVLLLQGIICISADFLMVQTVNLFFLILIPLFLLENTETHWIFLYPVVAMGNSIAAVCTSFILALALNMTNHELIYTPVYVVICQFIPVVLLLFFLILKKIRPVKAQKLKIGRRQYIIFYTGAICAYLIIAFMQMMTDKPLDDNMRNVAGLATSLLCLIYVVNSIWQGIVMYREEEYRKKTELYEEYMRLQENRIQAIIEQDEKMRSFRHDIKAHIRALSAYSEEGSSAQLRRYLEDMTDHSAIHDVKTYTGNKAVDAIIREELKRSASCEIIFEFKGELPAQTEQSVFDICTIISNLMRNAVEACEKLAQDQERRILLVVYPYNENIYIYTENSIANPVKVSGKKIKTTKSDTKNHGLGSENIRKTVEKYQGSIEYINKQGRFAVEILI